MPRRAAAPCALTESPVCCSPRAQVRGAEVGGEALAAARPGALPPSTSPLPTSTQPLSVGSTSSPASSLQSYDLLAICPASSQPLPPALYYSIPVHGAYVCVCVSQCPGRGGGAPAARRRVVLSTASSIELACAFGAQLSTLHSLCIDRVRHLRGSGGPGRGKSERTWWKSRWRPSCWSLPAHPLNPKPYAARTSSGAE